MSDENGEKEVKCVFLGDSSVGKTCILSKFINGCFDTTKPTIGSAFCSKKLNIDGKDLNLMMWDTAGQEMYRGMAPMYYRNAKIAFIVFDITNSSSFDSVSYWCNELTNNSSVDHVVAIVGNKCDLEEKRKIPFERAQEFANKANASYFETSALNGTGIDRLFQVMSQQAVTLADDVDETPEIVETNLEEKKKAGCCN